MAIRKARRELQKTQKELAELLGLQGRAIGRWEWGQSGPTRRNRERLVRAVTAQNAEVGAALDAELTRLFPFSKKKPASPTPAPAPPPPPPPDLAALERTISALADDLDVSPKRTRAFVVDALRGVAAARFTIDGAIAALVTLSRPPTPALPPQRGEGGESHREGDVG